MKEEKLTSIKILIGDDKENMGDLYLRVFPAYVNPSNVRQETEPNSFLAEARKGIYDVILCDLRWTPEDDGYTKPYTGFELLPQLDGLAKEIVLSTSNKEMLEEGLRRGATAALAKGCNPKYFDEIFRRSLNGGDESK